MSSNGTYGEFLADLERAKDAFESRSPYAVMHPSTAKTLGIDPQVVDAVMAGAITDHPFLTRVEVVPGSFALRVGTLEG